MTVMSPDSELVGAYVTEGSETAFRTLVGRHANLVYSTAIRQLGDSGMAEEVTQNVFIALSKKAPRLGGVETLAGWLHRTAILESKARIRSELRRRSREQTAAALAEVERHEDTAMEAMVPLVDEALLQLREADRIALVLRFFENRSLREVGGVLGVDEDAARKRISRALIKVMDFFHARGITLPVGTGMATVLTGSAQAAPMGLVTSATNTALAAGKGASGVGLLLFHLINMGSKKAVIGCVLLAAAPLFWQGRVQADLSEQQGRLEIESVAAAEERRTLEARLHSASEALSALQMEVQTRQARLATLSAQRTGKVQAPIYQWDDSSPYMRVPKQFLTMLPPAVDLRNDKIELEETTTEFLQMSENESLQTQAAMQRFFDDYENALQLKMRRVEPTKEELRRHKPDQVRIYEIDDLTAEVKQLRTVLFTELEGILGSERLALFRESVEGWMPVEDGESSLSSEACVVEFPHRRAFYMPEPGSLSIPSSIVRESRGSVFWPTQLNKILRPFAPDLQDWIALARTKPPGSSGQP